MAEYTINYENDFPFILYASTEVATNARTAVITRSAYQFCTVEFVRDGAGFRDIDGQTVHIRKKRIVFPDTREHAHLLAGPQRSVV